MHAVTQDKAVFVIYVKFFPGLPHDKSHAVAEVSYHTKSWEPAGLINSYQLFKGESLDTHLKVFFLAFLCKACNLGQNYLSVEKVCLGLVDDLQWFGTCVTKLSKHLLWANFNMVNRHTKNRGPSTFHK